jgi:ribosomal-protein-alanine N-acetyltransferase
LSGAAGSPGPYWWARADAGDGVLLRRPEETDAAGVLSVHGDARVYALDPDLVHTDLAMSAEFLVPTLDHWATHGFGYWMVLVPAVWWPPGATGPIIGDDGRAHAGMGGIQHYDLVGEPVLNVYYRFAPAVQGRGLARRVLEASVRLAAERAPGLDLVVRTRPANAAARRVAERAGFVDQGLEPGTTDMQLLRLRVAT